MTEYANGMDGSLFDSETFKLGTWPNIPVRICQWPDLSQQVDFIDFAETQRKIVYMVSVDFREGAVYKEYGGAAGVNATFDTIEEASKEFKRIATLIENYQHENGGIYW